MSHPQFLLPWFQILAVVLSHPLLSPRFWNSARKFLKFPSLRLFSVGGSFPPHLLNLSAPPVDPKMTSPCSPPVKPPIPPPRTPVPQASSIPSPSLPPSPLDFLAIPSPPWSQQTAVPPPPPLPPPPAATGPAPPHVFGLEKSQLLKEALEKAGPVPKGREDVKRLLKLHKDRFRGDLRWILFCADLPSLIQEGPQYVP